MDIKTDCFSLLIMGHRILNFRLTHKFSVLSTDTGFENLIQATDMTALTSFSSTSSASTVVGEGTVKEVKDFVATKVR